MKSKVPVICLIVLAVFFLLFFSLRKKAARREAQLQYVSASIMKAGHSPVVQNILDLEKALNDFDHALKGKGMAAKRLERLSRNILEVRAAIRKAGSSLEEKGVELKSLGRDYEQKIEMPVPAQK